MCHNHRIVAFILKKNFKEFQLRSGKTENIEYHPLMVVRQLRINIVLIKQIIEIMNSVFNHPLMTPNFQKYWITDIGLYFSIFFFNVIFEEQMFLLKKVILQ